jgi:peptidoglycan/LPS O-acetylase OafA/YrhL
MRIRELDGLRGIAVLTVVAHHYLLWVPRVTVVAGNGWLGVDLFFILSGFLISSILLDMRGEQHYFRTFYLRRAFRIFPPYLIVVTIYLVASIALRRVGSFGLWAQFLFYYSSLMPGLPTDKIGHVVVPFVAMGLGVLWSLSIEEIYYTIWAPLVRFCSHRVFTSLLVAMAVLAPLFRWLTFNPNGAEFYTFYCRMDGLAYGSMLALVIGRRRLALPRWAKFDRLIDLVSGVFVLFTAALWISGHGAWGSRILATLYLSMADISLALVTFAVIRYAGGGAWWLKPLRSPLLRWFGKISYTLYLVNYPVLRLSQYIVADLHLSRRPSAVLETVGGLFLSLLASVAMWHYVESPALRLKDKVCPAPAHSSV